MVSELLAGSYKLLRALHNRLRHLKYLSLTCSYVLVGKKGRCELRPKYPVLASCTCQVEIDVPLLGKEYVFPCDECFGKKRADGLIERVLEVRAVF